MSNGQSAPKTLLEVVNYFSDERRAFEWLLNERWPSGVACPRCKSDKVHFIETRMMWRCNGCKRQFSIKVGTIFEDSPIKLSKWLPAMWLIANCKNGISSYELARDLGVTQKTAWFMLHRIRLALQEGTIEKIGGEVEVDETYIGGKARNMHWYKRQTKAGPGTFGKAAVMGMLERGGKVRTLHIGNTDRKTLSKNVFDHVSETAKLFTDAHSGYDHLAFYYEHQVIDHAQAYVRGNVHTNSLENYWSLLKRTLRGTYVSVEPFHLFRYLDEQAFRFNTRHNNDSQRFNLAVANVAGKRLTYKSLTGKEYAAGI